MKRKSYPLTLFTVAGLSLLSPLTVPSLFADDDGETVCNNDGDSG